MVACRPEPDVLNFSHIVVDVQYMFIIHYLHININRPHHFIILSLPLSFPHSFNHTHSTQYTTLHRPPLQLPLAGWVLSFLTPPLSA